jgi:hypothetical protein
MEKLKRNTRDGASSVSVVTRLRDGTRWQRVPISRKGKNWFSLFECLTKPDALPTSLSMGTAGLLGKKVTDRVTKTATRLHLVLTVENKWSFTSTLSHPFIARAFIAQLNNFTYSCAQWGQQQLTRLSILTKRSNISINWPSSFLLLIRT